MCDNASKGAVGAVDVVVLADNRIRIDTGNLSGSQHTSAGKFLLALMSELAVVEESRQPLAHVHEHAHEHAHDHISVGHKHG